MLQQPRHPGQAISEGSCGLEAKPGIEDHRLVLPAGVERLHRLSSRIATTGTTTLPVDAGLHTLSFRFYGPARENAAALGGREPSTPAPLTPAPTPAPSPSPSPNPSPAPTVVVPAAVVAQHAMEPVAAATAVVDDRASVQAALDALDALQVFLQTQLNQALAVTVTFGGNDGD